MLSCARQTFGFAFQTNIMHLHVMSMHALCMQQNSWKSECNFAITVAILRIQYLVADNGVSRTLLYCDTIQYNIVHIHLLCSQARIASNNHKAKRYFGRCILNVDLRTKSIDTAVRYYKGSMACFNLIMSITRL